MDNSQFLDKVADSIREAETELNQLNSLSRDIVSAQKTVASLDNDIESLHLNSDHLEPKVRVSKLNSATAALSLAQSDLKSATNAFAAQRNKTLVAGNQAATQVMITRDKLLLRRIQNCERWIRTEFDLRRIPVGVSTLVMNHISVAAIRDLPASNRFFGVGLDLDAKLRGLAELSKHFVEVRKFAELEEGLILAQPEPVVAELAA